MRNKTENEMESEMETETKPETATEARIYCRLVYKIVRFIYPHTHRHTHTLVSSDQAALPQRKTNNFSSKRGSAAKRRAEQLTGAYRGRIVTFYWLP